MQASNQQIQNSKRVDLLLTYQQYPIPRQLVKVYEKIILQLFPKCFYDHSIQRTVFTIVAMWLWQRYSTFNIIVKWTRSRIPCVSQWNKLVFSLNKPVIDLCCVRNVTFISNTRTVNNTLCDVTSHGQRGVTFVLQIDVCRRTHNYYPFITSYLRMLAEQGLLNDMVNQLTQSKKKIVQPTVTNNNSNKSKKRPINDKKKSSSHPSKSKKRK